MFKKLAILTLIATPAFAHQTPFDQPDFLQMSGGNAVAAQELAMFCSATGKSLIDCKDTLAGNGNLKQEAARKCIQRMLAAPSFIFKDPSGEPAGSRMHQLQGTIWHSDYRDDGTGSHKHGYSEADRKRAVKIYEAQLIREAVEKVNASLGGTEKTSSQGVNGGLELGASAGVHGIVSFGAEGGDSTTKIVAPLSAETMRRIEKEAQAAYDNPMLAQVIPSILCMKKEKTCLVSGGKEIPNPDYESEKEKSKDKKHEKKGANNTPPKHEEDSRDSSNSSIDHSNGGLWADNDTVKSPDDPMIATSADVDLSAKSPMENCLDKEYLKLDKEVGSKTVDANANETEKAKRESALSLWKSGYCDESFYGRATCQAYKNKQNSVVAVTIIAERKEAAASALKSLKTTGFCDPQALGGQFCRDQQTQWNRTPADRMIAPKPTRPGTPIRTLPGN